MDVGGGVRGKHGARRLLWCTALGFGASLRRCPDPESPPKKYPKRSRYKHAKSPYRIHNWPEYEGRLLRRGDLTVRLSDMANASTRFVDARGTNARASVRAAKKPVSRCPTTTESGEPALPASRPRAGNRTPGPLANRHTMTSPACLLGLCDRAVAASLACARR